jgi:hypothetical protein
MQLACKGNVSVICHFSLYKPELVGLSCSFLSHTFVKFWSLVINAKCVTGWLVLLMACK